MKSRKSSSLNEFLQPVLSGKLLGIDFGLRRVGLAVCDPQGRIAVGAGRIEGSSGRNLILKITKEAKGRGVEGIVVGRPAATRGNDVVTRGAARIAEEIVRYGFKVTMWSEGYTSAAALAARKHFGGKKSSDKGWIDEAAAIILLQDYLAWARGKSG